MVLGGLVLSHWVLDWFTHRPDLQLWPSGPMVGLGLWNSVPGTILVEASLLLVAFGCTSTLVLPAIGSVGGRSSHLWG